MLSQSELVKKVKQYNPSVDSELLKKAYEFAEKAHSKQVRASGEPYFTHPLAVTEILLELKLDVPSLITGLLHDTVEDTEVTIDLINKEFGEDVALLVDGVTKLNKIAYQPENLRQAENFRKFLLAMSQDIRILVVKIADRLHNMRTLYHVKSKAKRVRISRETLEVYAPLTERIGIHKLKDELQDIAFTELHSEVRESIIQRLEFLKRESGKDIVERNIKHISSIINKQKIKCHVYGREKKPYSIWQKMQRKNISFEQLSDIMAFRIIVPEYLDCYAVLGLIHEKYHMIPGTFKDYISTPKNNGYQSLHTTVIGPEQQKIEIQIRTEMMHEIAEYGIAAHWCYKQGVSKSIDPDKYRWIKELLHILDESPNIDEFFSHTRHDMYSDQVFCFSPRGDLIALPQGATAVDFAYAIHSEIGNTCMGVKINGVIAPLRTQLNNGDQVEVICSKNQKPSETWEEFVVTGKARSQIRKYVRGKKQEQFLQDGEEILGRYFVERQMPFNNNVLQKILHVFSKKSVEEIFIAVGEGVLARVDVFKACYPEYEEKKQKPKGLFSFFKRDKRDKIERRKRRKVRNQKFINQEVRGVIPGMAVSYAGCCFPVPGDRILGVVHSGRGVSIHRSQCSNLKRIVGKENIINLTWNTQDRIKSKFVSRLRIIIASKHGSIAGIIAMIDSCKINVANFKIANKSDTYIETFIDIEISNVKDLYNLKATLRSSKQIFSVERVI